MIRPRNDGGFDIELIRADGALRIIPVYRGHERRAFRLILAYRKADLMTFEEAAQAMCAMNQLTKIEAPRQSAKGGRVARHRSNGPLAQTCAGKPPSSDIAGSSPAPWRLAAFRGLVSRVIDAVVGCLVGKEETCDMGGGGK